MPKRSKLPIVLTVVAVAAVLLIVVVLASGIGQSSGQTIKNGDYIAWELSGDVGGLPVSGTVTLTISEVSASTCRMTYTSNSPFYNENSGIYTFHTTNGVWTSNGLTGVALEDASYFVGNTTVSTAFGSKVLSHYQFTYQGLTFDYWVVQGSGIPYGMEISDPTSEIIMTISDTNVAWIKQL